MPLEQLKELIKYVNAHTEGCRNANINHAIESEWSVFRADLNKRLKDTFNHLYEKYMYIFICQSNLEKQIFVIIN